jgi:glucose-1-phosphate thymidylyltransferase
MRDGVTFTPVEVDGWHDCGEEEGILATNAILLARLELSAGIEGCRVIDPNWIDDSAAVIDSTIGPNVSIQAGCVIENSSLENCIVREGTKITNSTIKDSIIPENSVINNNAVEASGECGISSNEKK